MTANALPFLLYQNVFDNDNADPIATDTETGYDVLNLIDWREYTFWQADSAGTKYITVDYGTAVSVDTLGVAGHNFYTASATVSVESSPDNTTWTERLAGFSVTSDDVFAKTFTPASARYWRLKIVTAVIAARMAILTAGSRMDFEKYPNFNFDPDAQGIEAETDISQVGYMLGSTINYYPREFNISFKNLTPEWCRNTFYPVWIGHLSLMKPFFIAWDITNHPLEIYLVRLKNKHKLAMPYSPMKRILSLDIVGLRE